MMPRVGISIPDAHGPDHGHAGPRSNSIAVNGMADMRETLGRFHRISVDLLVRETRIAPSAGVWKPHMMPVNG